ncbi:hypothetical protein Tco_0404543 [Tanacetum coccineum]
MGKMLLNPQHARFGDQQEMHMIGNKSFLIDYQEVDGGFIAFARSPKGGCQFLGKRLISWQCKKQTIVANSTTEAVLGDGIQDELGVKTGSRKVNAARHDLVLLGENKNAEFHQTVDFLTTSSIHYALTVFTNMKRKNKDFSGRITPLFASMLVPQVVEGEGSGQPSEPQPPSSTSPPSQVTIVATQHQKTHKPRRAKRGRDTEITQSSGPTKRGLVMICYTREKKQVIRGWPTTASSLEAEQESDALTRFETASKKSHDPPLSKGNTSRSGEDNMEHLVDLMDFVPPTPYDSPLSGGHTPGSDEGRPNFNELINLCTQLSNRVLALENSKTAQDLVIQKLKKRVKRLEKALRARTPGMKLFKIGTSRRKGLDKENVSKQGRKSNKTKPMFNDSDFDVLDDAMENVEGGSTAKQITAAGDT